MMRPSEWATLALQLSAVVNAGSLLPIDLERWNWNRALVVGSHLYIDSGEVPSPFNQTYVSTFTTAIDLRNDWTTADVKGTYIEKPPGYVYSRRPLMYANTAEDTIYTYGGWPFWGFQTEGFGAPGYFSSNGTAVDNSSPPGFVPYDPSQEALWALKLDGNGGGSWEKSIALARTLNVAITHGSIDVQTPETFYSFGGQAIGAQSPKSDAQGQRGYYTVPRDASTSWSSSSNSGFSVATPGGSPYLAFGEAVYTSVFGSAGAIILFGGFSTNSGTFLHIQNSDGSQLWDNSKIAIYDIANSKWMEQEATGDIPEGRWGFCAKAVSDNENKTVDIFMHGGAFANIKGTGAPANFADVYVLTLPSFVWTKIPDSGNADPDGRSIPSCAIIGNHQLAVIGGNSLEFAPEPVDPFPNAIGIFDLNALSWTPQYNASAGSYVRHSLLADVSNTTPTPQSWSSVDTQKLFEPSSDNSKKNTNVGAIVGGVVGGVVGLGLLVGAGWFFYRRMRRRQQQFQAGSADYDDLEKPLSARQQKRNTVLAELEVQRAELAGHNARQELPVSEPPQEKDDDQPHERKLNQYNPGPTAVHELPS